MVCSTNWGRRKSRFARIPQHKRLRCSKKFLVRSNWPEIGHDLNNSRARHRSKPQWDKLPCRQVAESALICQRASSQQLCDQG